MPLMFHRKLALPLWVIVFVALALTASPPATPFLTSGPGIAVLALTIAGLVFSLRPSRSDGHVVSYRPRHEQSAAISMIGGTSVRTLNEAKGDAGEDALDLVRMDDDGGWQLGRS